MNKRHYEHTLPNIRGSLSNTYVISALKTNVPSIALTMLTPKAAGFPISSLNLVATGEY